MQSEGRRLELDGRTPRAMAQMVLEQSVHRAIVALAAAAPMVFPAEVAAKPEIRQAYLGL